MKQINLSYNIPILLETSTDGNDFIIQGTAINSTVTDNNHKFLSEELQSATQTLMNKPLLKDHDNSVDSVIGRVILASYDETSESVKFKARINQTAQGKNIRELIKSGDLNTVSIGANVKSLEEENGMLIPRGISFKELSVVAVPADNDATFTFRGNDFSLALKEAYKKVKEEMHCPECDKVFDTKIELSKHMEVKHPKQSNLSSSEEIQINKKEEVMEKDETIQAKDLVLESLTALNSKLEAHGKLLETVISDVSEFKSFKSEVSEKIKVIETPKVEKVIEKVDTITEAKPKVNEVDVEEDETDELDLDEKNKYKIVQRHKSFTIERKYR